MRVARPRAADRTRVSEVRKMGLTRRGNRFAPIAMALVVAATMAGPGGALAASADPASSGAVPACTPELVYSLRPGREMDATSQGSGFAANVVYTDANGNPQATTTATVAWFARAIVGEPDRRATGVVPDIGGNLDLVIETAAGERLTFSATCIAAAIGFPAGMLIYANGITRGWPGAAARRTLVHFEAYTDGSAYVALVDGVDCNLNFDALLVTRNPYISGSATFAGLPPNLVFAETDCPSRFGDPFPPTRAPGLND